MYSDLCDKLHEQHISDNDKDVQVYFYWCLPRQYLHSLHNYEWTKDIVALDNVCLYSLLLYRKCLCFYKFYCLLYRCVVSRKKFYQWIRLKFLICIFSIRRLGKVCWNNCLFEIGWKNNHLVLLKFRDYLFDFNHVETFSSSTFILSKSVPMFLWDRNKFVLSALVPLKALAL